MQSYYFSNYPILLNNFNALFLKKHQPIKSFNVCQIYKEISKSQHHKIFFFNNIKFDFNLILYLLPI